MSEPMSETYLEAMRSIAEDGGSAGAYVVDRRHLQMLLATIDALKAGIAAVLEEAAKVAEETRCCPGGPAIVARKIRALKSETQTRGMDAT